MPTFSDASGNGYSAHIIAPLTRSSGPLSAGGVLAVPTAPSFAALGSLARTASMPALPLNGPYSIEYWIKLFPGLITWMNPIGWGNADGYAFVTGDFYADGAFVQDLDIYQHYPDQYGYLPLVTGEPGNGPPQDARWHHVVITNTGGPGLTRDDGSNTAYAFYLDGAAPNSPIFVGNSTSLGTQGDSTATVTVGDGPTLSSSAWDEALNGGLAHVAVYSRVLDPVTVQRHYNAAGYYNLDVSLPASVQLDDVLSSSHQHTQALSASLTAAGGTLGHNKAPWAFPRGTFVQPQHLIRTLATPQGASPLRALPQGDTAVTDAALAPADAALAYLVDWSNTLAPPLGGYGIASVTATASMIPTLSVPWTSATDVTTTFLISVLQQGSVTRVVVGNGAQTLGQIFRVRLQATFTNTPPTVLEAYFDLTCAES